MEVPRLSWILHSALIVLSLASKSYLYADLVDTEYDYSILDPDTIYGSPYGGFSRHALHRLSQLPMHLPVFEKNEEDQYDPEFFQVRDATGKLYSCRTYLQDDLEPGSLHESMFETVKLKQKALLDDGTEKSQSNEYMDSASESTNTVGETISVNQASAHDHMTTLFDVENKLSQLKQMCAQIHKGWWSFEWCFERHASQFHIDFDADTSKFNIQDISNLGNFARRTIQAQLSHIPPSPFASGKVELARVVDEYTGGDQCPDTQRPRTTTVTLQCCSDKWMEVGKLRVHRNQVPTSEVLLALVEVKEDPICTYNMTVCSPMLCLRDAPRANEPHHVSRKSPGEESIREILQRTIGNTCILTPTGTWWSYEVCHGDAIRQFHEANLPRKGGEIMRVREEEHVLGLYQSWADDITKEDEHKHVTNANNPEKGGGNHAYYEIEYTQGGVCDSKEVQDRVVGNSASSMLERSTSVRYYCGEEIRIAVREDRTCHYIIEVMVPALCEHPLFRPPVSQMEVVKCVPSEDKAN